MNLQYYIMSHTLTNPGIWICKSLWCSKDSFSAGVLNLLVPAYPQSKIVPLCVPPNQNCMPFAYPQIKKSTQKGFFLAGFFLFLRTPCDLFTYPQGYVYPRLRTADLVDSTHNIDPYDIRVTSQTYSYNHTDHPFYEVIGRQRCIASQRVSFYTPTNTHMHSLRSALPFPFSGLRALCSNVICSIMKCSFTHFTKVIFTKFQ